MGDMLPSSTPAEWSIISTIDSLNFNQTMNSTLDLYAFRFYPIAVRAEVNGQIVLYPTRHGVAQRHPWVMWEDMYMNTS